MSSCKKIYFSSFLIRIHYCTASHVQMSGMLGASAAQAPNEEQLLGKLETMKAMIEDVNRQFQDPVRARARTCECVSV